MKTFRVLLGIGIIEILLGIVTLLTTLSSILFSLNKKSFNVLIFVILAALLSTLLGIGVLKFHKLAYQLLLYFSSVIILSKILIFMDIIQFNGALETFFPSTLKNGISVLYHGFIIYYFQKKEIKEIFYH